MNNQHAFVLFMARQINNEFAGREFTLINRGIYKMQLNFSCKAMDRLNAARIFVLSDTNCTLVDDCGRERFNNEK